MNIILLWVFAILGMVISLFGVVFLIIYLFSRDNSSKYCGTTLEKLAREQGCHMLTEY